MWQQQLKDSITSIEDLPLDFKLLNRYDSKEFPTKVTPHYLSLMDKDNINDPLKKIVFSTQFESNTIGIEDEMGEKEDYRIQGLQHRYSETALLVVNDICASYCRYCFRKRLFSPEYMKNETIDDLEDALIYIKEHKEITNVLLSGGDPLLTSVKRLEKILNLLADIEHIEFIRIGTKMLSFLPQRIIEDIQLRKLFEKIVKKKSLIIISHFDHANEISMETKEAVLLLNKIGINIYSQGVLLKDINNTKKDIKNLLNKLIQTNITPYYLFHALPVLGSTHFQTTIENTVNIMEKVSQELAGISKSVRFILPHYTGKVEILGKDKDSFYFKYHEARKKQNIGKLFKVKRDNEKTWFLKEEIEIL